MSKFMMGAILLPVGFVVSMIPPFIFGIPIIMAAFGLAIAGLFGTTKSAAKATAAGIRAVQEHNANKDYAARMAELEARERAVAAQESRTSTTR
jgi:hypothetical protein